MEAEQSNLKRPRYTMPGDVRRALELRGLMKVYEERPDDQRNNYPDWIP